MAGEMDGFTGRGDAKADAIKAEVSVLRMGVVASDGGLKVKVETRGNWQNLSI